MKEKKITDELIRKIEFLEREKEKIIQDIEKIKGQRVELKEIWPLVERIKELILDFEAIKLEDIETLKQGSEKIQVWITRTAGKVFLIDTQKKESLNPAVVEEFEAAQRNYQKRERERILLESKSSSKPHLN